MAPNLGWFLALGLLTLGAALSPLLALAVRRPGTLATVISITPYALLVASGALAAILGAWTVIAGSRGDVDDSRLAAAMAIGIATGVTLLSIGFVRVRYGPAGERTFHQQVARNRTSSSLLVFSLVSILGATGFIIGASVASGSGRFESGVAVGIVAAVVAVGAAMLAWFGGSGMVLDAANARPLDETDDPQIGNVVTELSIAAGIPTPKVYLIEDRAMNALSVGRDPRHASIALTTGLVDGLDREELQGVVAHELSHIRNFDSRHAVFVAVLAGAVVLMTDLFFHGVLRTITSGRWASARGKNSFAGMLAILGFLLFLLAVAAILRILAPLATAMVQGLVSREREYLADATSADITRNPEGLERALMQLERSPRTLDIENRAIQHLFFINPTRDEEPASSVFATHPRIRDRVNRLRRLQSEPPLEAVEGGEGDRALVDNRRERRRRFRLRQRRASDPDTQG